MIEFKEFSDYILVYHTKKNFLVFYLGKIELEEEGKHYLFIPNESSNPMNEHAFFKILAYIYKKNREL